MKKNKLGLALAIGLVLSSAPVSAECYLKQITNNQYTGEIQSILDIEPFVTPWKDDKRKCNVEFNALVDGKWHQGFGAYAFGNDISEQRACAIALDVGKTNLMEELNPQGIQSESILICSDMKRPVRKTGIEGLQLVMDRPSFAYKGAMCNWFFETVREGTDLNQYTIIACAMKPNQWEIVDRF